MMGITIYQPAPQPSIMWSSPSAKATPVVAANVIAAAIAAVTNARNLITHLRRHTHTPWVGVYIQYK
ncbi:MAG: hypothetical protein WBF66_08240 [Dehalococcoidia bacterium]